MPARFAALRPRIGRPAVCCAVAVSLGLLALAWRQPPATALESAESDDEQSDPVRRIGHDFQFFDVKGFDEDSVHRRERIDAADQDANAALQWAIAQRPRRESARSAESKHVEISTEEDKTAPKVSGRANPERNWITPFRASEAASHVRAVAPGRGGGGRGRGGCL